MATTPEFGTVFFDGAPYPVEMDIGYANLATFSRKVVDGDYGRDSDELISAKIWTQFTGGIGVENNREGSDDGRCWYTTLYAQRPFQVTLSRKVTAVSGASYPLGDHANEFYAASATALYKWNETTDLLGSSLGTLSAAPVHRGLSFNGKLYIPCGASGFHTWDGATVSAIQTTALPVNFAEWDNRLFALGTDGALKSSFDGSTWSTEAQLNTGLTPRRLVVWMDRTDQDTLFLITDRRVFAFDPTSGILIPTRLEVPAHPDNGRGATVWQPGEDLYIGFGLQVSRYSAGMSQIDPDVGPDRDEGLPDALRGRIVDLCAEHLGLLALLEGVSTSSTPATPASEFDAGHSDEPTEVSSVTTNAYSALLQWNGFGWHPLWQSASASGSATFCAVSGASSAYRIWWGWNSGLYTVELPRSFASPRQQFRTGEGQFEASGYLDTGWYDGNMREFDKLASHIEVNMENGTSTETVLVEYRTDWNDGWTTLGTVNAKGKTILPFGVQTLTDGSFFSYGQVFRRIRFQLTFARTASDSKQTPVLDSLVLKHIKLPLSGESFTVTLPLGGLPPEGWSGRTATQIKRDVENLLAKQGFIRMEHGQDPTHRSHRVRIASVNGLDRTGEDDRGRRTIVVVGIPLTGYEG